MRMPGFTAERGFRQTDTHYGGVAHGYASQTSQLRPALVAPTVCKTSACVAVGRCKVRVRCCRDFRGTCTCRTAPCFTF